MPYISLDPATGKVLRSFTSWDSQRLAEMLESAHRAQLEWGCAGFDLRSQLMRRAAAGLRKNLEEHAALITREMGKPIKEARAEVEKCALGCEYYADHAARFLQDEAIGSDAGRSYVAYLPLGTVLGVMPWNFPFWQVFRFAAPTLMAGNAVVVKHASNTPQCALALEEVFRQAGFPDHLFTTLMIEADQVADAIASPHVHAVTLTGSEPAGRKVAASAG